MANEAANNPQQQKQVATAPPTPPAQALVTKETSAFGMASVERSSELAAVAVAEAARARVESAYVMAMKNPRHEETARTKIMASCRNPGFAIKAKFRKPVGGEMINGRWEPKFVVGPSIRFAEEMLRCWKNVLVQQTSIYDDHLKRIVAITTQDLESNTTYSKEIFLEKTVERSSAKDREVVGQRMNSQNRAVYIVRSTEDELNIKESALASKVIRNNGLRLIPQHIQDEAMAIVDAVIRDKAAKNPEAERREILDGFAKKGIAPLDIERYMGGPSAQFSTDDLLRLREMLTSIEDGHSTWQEFIEGTTSQTTSEISEKSQVETKGKEINEKLKAVVQERGVEASIETAKKPEPVKPAEPAQGDPVKIPEKTLEPIIPAQETKQEATTLPATPAEPAQAETTPAPPESEPLPASESAKAPLAAMDSEEIQNRCASAELFLKTNPAGVKKYNSILSIMKVRLSGKQQPLDVIESAQLPFYCAQLEKAVKSIRETPEKK